MMLVFCYVYILCSAQIQVSQKSMYHLKHYFFVVEAFRVLSSNSFEICSMVRVQ